MKKLVSVMLGLLVVFTMSVFVLGCGGPQTEPAADDTVVQPDETVPTAPPEPAAAAADDVTPQEPAAEVAPEAAAPAEGGEAMTEEPAAQEEATAEAGDETAADSGEALTDEFDDFDYSVGGGAASKRR